MRIFYKMTGSSKWNEDHIDKITMMNDDLIICHKASLHQQLQGMELMLNKRLPSATPAKNNETFQLDPGSFLFFTKIPESLISQRVLEKTNHTVVFGDDWFQPD